MFSSSKDNVTPRARHLGLDLAALQKVTQKLFNRNPIKSFQGFCGNTRNHCKCATCIDYSKVKPTTAAPAPRTSVKRAEEEITEGPEVRVQQGQLKGRTVSGGEDVGTWHEFWSVPYARAPLGLLRFKRPVPANAWSDVKEATSPPPACPQRLSAGSKKGEVVGEEDCLFLNVFTPEVKPSKPMAVMVWIHGGAFVEVRLLTRKQVV